MIVRISGEGQWELDDDCEQRVNRLDDEAVSAVVAGDEQRFRRLWAEMIEMIESEGNPLEDDALVASDVILPPRDTSFDEARRDFSGDGLIPGV